METWEEPRTYGVFECGSIMKLLCHRGDLGGLLPQGLCPLK